MNLIEAIAPKICFTDPTTGEVDLNLYELPEAVDKWPEVKVHEGEPDETEALDLENVEVLKIDRDELVVWCGGDWQEPMTVTIRMVDGRPVVVSAEDGGDYNDHNFLSNEEVKAVIRKG